MQSPSLSFLVLCFIFNTPSELISTLVAIGMVPVILFIYHILPPFFITPSSIFVTVGWAAFADAWFDGCCATAASVTIEAAINTVAVLRTIGLSCFILQYYIKYV